MNALSNDNASSNELFEISHENIYHTQNNQIDNINIINDNNGNNINNNQNNINK